MTIQQQTSNKALGRVGLKMLNQFSRTQLLYGAEIMEKFAASRVAVFGIGGVGGYVVEALVRSGVGALDLIDDDRVCLTNINRQILATKKTVGKYKVDVARERVLDINPDCEVRTYRTFFLPETEGMFDFREYDYVVDAIDTVTGKLAIIEKAKKDAIPVISCMGAGNKLNASMFEVADIYETTICPLAKVMRHECRKRGIDSLKVVYSKEKPVRPLEDMSISCRQHCICPPGTARKCTERRDIPGSTAFVPSVAGLIIAGEVLNDLAGINKNKSVKAAGKNKQNKEPKAKKQAGKYPDRKTATEILREAESCNPGPWGDHSRTVAHCAEMIAVNSGMDPEKAYVLGLLHDIGRKFGKRHLGHVSDGYSYMMSLGYDDAARICLTHSFNGKDIDGYIGNRDTTPQETELIVTKLQEVRFDDYDRLIQLCDAISGSEGVMDIIDRMTDVKNRYGSYDRAKWDNNLELKEYFERLMGKDLYEAVDKEHFRP